MDRQPTITALIHDFTTFLTVSIHTILRIRDIYPATSFLTARAYNYPVFQSRHPKVCGWVNDAVAAVEAELLNGTVGRIAVIIYSPQQQPLERFMFDVSKFPVVPKEDHHTPIAPRPESKSTDLTVDLEEQYRGAMAKLTACGSKLSPLPKGCSFSMAIELKERADPPIGHPQPWIPAQPSLQASRKDGSSHHTGTPSERGSDLGGVKTTPLRAVDASDMLFEMWVEEGKAKAKESVNPNSGPDG